MPDLFFRGFNRLDWLYSLMLQSSFDWDSDALTEQVAAQLGFVSLARHDLGPALPPVGVVVTSDYVFVLCGSTHNVYQWLGNVLGSAGGPAPFVTGGVSLYFYGVALAHYLAVRSEVLAAVPGRRLVIAGFSLGAASATILKEIFLGNHGLASAVFASSSPRVGLTDFAASYPADNFNRFQYRLDPVPGVPPTIWAGRGIHSGWTPFPPLVTYAHVQPGWTLDTPNVVNSGDDIPSFTSIVLDFNLGTYRQYHDQGLYAKILRGGLPNTLTDGQDGYATASQLDDLAAQVFGWTVWPWSTGNFFGGSSVADLVQMSVYIRDLNGLKGYQEIYYFNTNDPAAIFAAVGSPSFQSQLSARTAFMSGSCEIYALRCSAVSPAPKQSLLQKFNPTYPGQISAAETEMDNCMTFFLYSATRAFKRQIHYGAIPSTYISNDKLTPTGTTAIGLVDAWIAKVRSFGTLCIKAPTYSATVPFGTITKALTTDLVKLNLNAPVTVAPNQKVNISQIRSFPLLRGDWLAVGTGGIASNQLEILGTQKFSPQTATAGVLRVVDPASSGGFAAITSQVFNSASIRERGRPAFLGRGRRSALLHHR